MTPARQARLLQWLEVSRRYPAPLPEEVAVEPDIEEVWHCCSYGTYGVTFDDFARLLSEGLRR